VASRRSRITRQELSRVVCELPRAASTFDTRVCRSRPGSYTADRELDGLQRALYGARLAARVLKHTQLGRRFWLQCDPRVCGSNSIP